MSLADDILLELQFQMEPMTRGQIASAIQQKPKSVGKALSRLVEQGNVIRIDGNQPSYVFNYAPSKEQHEVKEQFDKELAVTVLKRLEVILATDIADVLKQIRKRLDGQKKSHKREGV